MGVFGEPMRRMDFCDRWVNFIIVCVKTVTYLILVNGEPQGLIQPTRGIRQGDSLSPFLFLLCTKGLHGLISKAVADGDLRGFTICRQGPNNPSIFCR